ncbi:uncharacterized protein QC763_501815 [Podospora pseudopauciseta]|uniref:Uncharacterized protein n=1 Tax=Podospora pseudopauciseta TaxID=2093780 RepID=A0ABR0H768_9PEZI|nr:hypothetical protein QC763_501815 [Podospora pseudopauciseta]
MDSTTVAVEVSRQEDTFVKVFDDDSKEFWHETTLLTFIKLLQSSGYSNQDIEIHSKWYTPLLRLLPSFYRWARLTRDSTRYNRFIIPALGGRPQPGKKPLFNARITADGSPMELSVNFKETSNVRTVRFTIEATGPEAGTPTDPYNQEQTTRLLHDMTKSIPSIHLGQYNTFIRSLFLPASTAPSLLPKVPHETPLSQAWVAFDLAHGGDIMAKVYFMPFLKWLHTASSPSAAVSTKDIIFDIARQCDGPYGSYNHPIALLDSYLLLLLFGAVPANSGNGRHQLHRLSFCSNQVLSPYRRDNPPAGKRCNDAWGEDRDGGYRGHAEPAGGALECVIPAQDRCRRGYRDKVCLVRGSVLSFGGGDEAWLPWLGRESCIFL